MGAGGFRLAWRVGRKALRLLEPGQMYCSHYLRGPAYGLVGVFDSNGLYHVFTTDGLRVDTLGMDAFRHGLDKTGMYAQSGESWYGAHYLNRDNGKVYLLMGRAQMTVYEVDGWQPGVIKPLAIVQPRIRLTARHLGAPHPLALELRDGKTAVPVATFRAALGGPPALDGTLSGWENAPPIEFGLDPARHVEVRGMFDRDQLYLCWQVRLPGPFQPAVVSDLRRLFTHETGADTLSFYLQTDPDAPPPGSNARSGDVRIVFAVVQEADRARPVALGLYATYPKENPQPMTYRSPVRAVSLAHVGVIADAELGWVADEDGRGFVLAARVPLASILATAVIRPGSQTTANFEATLGGRTKFWWANAGGLDNTLTTDEPSEAQLYPGSWAPLRFVW